MPKGDNNKRLSSNDIREIVRIYTTRNDDGTWTGSKLIARHFSVHQNCILYHLKRQSVKIRTPKEAHSGGKACRPVKNLPPDEPPPRCRCECGQSVEWYQNRNRWYSFAKGHFHGHRSYQDYGLLHREYIVNKHTASDVALDHNVSSATIIRWLKKHNIPVRTTGESLKLSGKVRGPNNPAWKGGVADWDYSHDWKSLCKTIKDRDYWICQLCGETRKRWNHSLHVHHIDEDKLNNHSHNLISLCSKCHYKAHGSEEIREKLSLLAISNC